jgi:alcohol dehydrogenase (NADP+)
MPLLALADGAAMPALGLGTWRLPPERTAATVGEALALGYRHLDAASIYGNEAEIGQALARAFAAGELRRDQFWITSKLWNDCHAPEAVRPACERSLAALGLEQLDLYLMHWPVAQRPGVAMPRSAADLIPLDQQPLAATWAAMEALVSAGLTRHIGVSNFNLAALRALQAGAHLQPAVLQVERHPLLQQPALLRHCQRTAYAPLGSSGDSRPPLLLEHPEVLAIATEQGLTPAQVLLAWGLGCGTAVIPKSLQPKRLAENLAAASVCLDAASMARLAALDRGQRLISGQFCCLPGGPYSLESLWGDASLS